MNPSYRVYGPLTKYEYRKSAVLRWQAKRRRISKLPIVPSLHSDRHLIDNASKGRRKGVSQCRQKGRPSSSGTQLLSLIPNEASRLPSVPNCPYCGAERFFHETANFCCSSGDIKIIQNALPVDLINLLTGQNIEAKKFRTMIRSYNNHLAFTSLGVKSDKALEKRNNGVYTFRIQGQVYHFLNDFLPSHGQSKNLQLYFHDTDFELNSRLQSCPRLSENTLSLLLDILKDNPYAQFFRTLSEISNLESYCMFLRSNPNMDQRVYNKPTVSQVAALWVDGEGNEELSHRDIRVYSHSGQSHSIQYYYGCYDPLQYPLMFPYGEPGWHQGIQKQGFKKRKRQKVVEDTSTSLISPHNIQTAENLLDVEAQVLNGKMDDAAFVSIREYYAYKFQIRSNDRSFILHFGRLFQQYSVDIYVKLETQRLDYYRSQQDDLRNEVLQGIVDAVSSGETEASKIGRRVVLPSSFIGGPRHMRRKYIDAMTLVQKFGKPDIFLTITCNPNWPEIKENLLYGEEAQDRPDLAVRVFHSKLEEMKDQLFRKHVFGEVAAFTYVIEFQKRGLPHAHFLLILKPECKLYQPDEYDNIVSAEIPDPSINSHLHRAVRKHMIHGPCGIQNPSNVCMKKNGRCRSSYPKEFSNQTTQTNNTYPKYKRPNNGLKVKVRGKYLDNRWVVPYNAYLLAKFDCHINVEICSTIKAVKYIYKYICKGNDKILFHLASDTPLIEIDEIQQFVSARWISPPEALWRLFRFNLGDINPPVVHLPLHLENYQPITFKKKQILSNILVNNEQRKTMLTEFFNMNRTNKLAQELNCTYSEFPDHFVWVIGKKMWKARLRGNSVGRIVIAHPTEGERYYLRLMLSKIRCPISFKDLRTYNGTTFDTYRESALVRGLLKDDDSQEKCLEEASTFHMPYELRRLFATILVFCCPNDPRQLWEKFEADMSNDFARNTQLTELEIKREVLQQINVFLQSMGKDITTYSIVPENFSHTDLEDLRREIRVEASIQVSEYDLNSTHLLNKEQKHIFDIISSHVYHNKAGAFFIDGPGGTGKTFLYRAMLADIRSKGYYALATATSGIAASLLPGGRTAHSRFKIPIDITDSTTCKISKQSALGELIKESKLIIWDEAPMSKRTSIEALDNLLQDLMDCKCHFGGKVVVLGGDFRQTLPVVRKGTKNETINASLINSPLWPNLQKMHLTKNMRSESDPLFTEFLLKVGNGELQMNDIEDIEIPPSMLLKYDPNDVTSSLHEMIDWVYPNIANTHELIHASVNKAILTTKNCFVDDINDLLI